MSVKDYLSKEEMRELAQKSDVRGAWEVLRQWLWIAGALAAAAWYPHPAVIAVSLFVLGGKQLACAIIMHDASHYSLFKRSKTNVWVGNWFGAYPIFHDTVRYRPYHLKHHAVTGRPDDPDLPLTFGYPAGKWSLTRKFLRDLTGLTGLKSQIGLLLMNLGIWKYNLGGRVIKEEGVTWKTVAINGARRLWGPLTANAAMFGLCWAAGAAWVYVLWPAAMLTTFQFSLRVRSMAEHSMVPDPLDDHKNTRTTYANIVEQVLFAPLNVNYHAEHHLLPGIPSYNYPKMHRLLKERGYYDDGVLATGYGKVVRMALNGK
jgi:fatty acid desaturase